MRSLVRFSLFVLVLSAVGAGLDAQGLPQFRPAVLASGAESLINRLDEKGLASAGQKDGAVMFAVVVARTGEAKQFRTYRGMPGTAALEQELRKKLENAKFAPAIYNHQPVDVILAGTLVYSEATQPHLHLLLNQDPAEIKADSDFIAPQPVFGADSAFTGLDYPTDIEVEVNAIVDLMLTVDAQGNPKQMTVVAEDPPLLGFAKVVAQDFDNAKFIPAFRDGDPVECTNTVYEVCYQPPDWKSPPFAQPLPETIPQVEPIEP
ncbi:MAG: hypothetical protein M3Y69_08795 [Verrucomicrobiota bacterium]|nr:hypothetical protein [Verrucomicrobiota bacterium]